LATAMPVAPLAPLYTPLGKLRSTMGYFQKVWITYGQVRLGLPCTKLKNKQNVLW